MTITEPSFPYFTWACADELEGRLKKSLYHGGRSDCMAAVSSAALSDLAVSLYVAAAPSPKRKLRPGYIGSISKRLAINPCTMMLGILYCERMRQINPEYLNRISSSDLFVVSLVVASKFLNDDGEDDEIFNDEWAEAGGLGVSTVNRLEREFLNAMQWRAYVSPKEFLLFCNRLETSIALKHGLDRGWFSYTDLTNILTQVHFMDVFLASIRNAFQVLLSCSLVYGLSVSILLSTAFCLNATLSQTNNGSVRDVINPYSDRLITRTRTSTAATTTTDEATRMPRHCEVTSPLSLSPEKSDDSSFRQQLDGVHSDEVSSYPNRMANSSTSNQDFRLFSNRFALDFSPTRFEADHSTQRLPETGGDGHIRFENVLISHDAFSLGHSIWTTWKYCYDRTLILPNVLKQQTNITLFGRQSLSESLFQKRDKPTIGMGLFLDTFMNPRYQLT